MKKIPAFLASSASAVYTNTFESLHILPGLLLLGVLLAACDPQSVIQANAPAAAFTEVAAYGDDWRDDRRDRRTADDLSLRALRFRLVPW